MRGAIMTRRKRFACAIRSAVRDAEMLGIRASATPLSALCLSRKAMSCDDGSCARTFAVRETVGRRMR